MDTLLLNLIRSGGPITTAELLNELCVLQRNHCVELAEVNLPAVRTSLETLRTAGTVADTPAGVWHACYARVTPPAERQGVLF